jgi:hypothetical protein
MSLHKFLLLVACQPFVVTAHPYTPPQRLNWRATHGNGTNSTQVAPSGTAPATLHSSTSTPTPTPIQLPGQEWAKKTCSDPGVTDASLDPSKRWELLDTRNALSAVNHAWNHDPVEEGHIQLKYPEMVSNFFQGPEHWACQNVDDTPCSTVVKCEDVKWPAGYDIFLLL